MTIMEFREQVPQRYVTFNTIEIRPSGARNAQVEYCLVTNEVAGINVRRRWVEGKKKCGKEGTITGGKIVKASYLTLLYATYVSIEHTNIIIMLLYKYSNRFHQLYTINSPFNFIWRYVML